MNQAEKLEQAKAPGFNFIEECEDHQCWLDRQAAQRERNREVVKATETTGSDCYEMRFQSDDSHGR